MPLESSLLALLLNSAPRESRCTTLQFEWNDSKADENGKNFFFLALWSPQTAFLCTLWYLHWASSLTLAIAVH